MSKERGFLFVVGLLLIAAFGIVAYLAFPHRVGVFEGASVTPGAPSVPVEPEGAETEQVGVDTGPDSIPSEVRFAEGGTKLLYVNDEKRLVLYDAADKTSKRLASICSDTPGALPDIGTRAHCVNQFIDYDISRDGKIVAYAGAAYEDPAPRIFILDLEKDEVKKLEQADPKIFESNPVFFPDASKIAYVRRTHDEYTNSYSDGEIWIRGLGEKEGSGRRILGDNSKEMLDISTLQRRTDESGNWDGGYYCISFQEIAAPRIRADWVSPDGKVIGYRISGWVPECSGYGPGRIQFSTPEGKNILINAGKERVKTMSGIFENIDWLVDDVSWLKDGSSVVEKGSYAAGYRQTSLYDKNRQELRVLHEKVGGSSTSEDMSVYDIRPLPDGTFLMLYDSYRGYASFLQRMNPNDTASMVMTSENAQSSVSWSSVENRNAIFDLRIIDDHTIVYKKNTDRHSILFLLDFTTGEKVEIGRLN